MAIEHALICAASVGCFVLGLGGCAHAYTPIAQDFGVCGRSKDVGTFRMPKGIDYDDGTVVYKNTTFHVYIGRHPNITGMPAHVSKLDNNIELLYSGATKSGDQYKLVYGYRNKIVINGVKVSDAVFIVLSAADNPVNRKLISTIGDNLVRCR